MSVSVLEKIKRDLDKIGGELWDIDGPDGALDRMFKKLSLLKAQIRKRKYDVFDNGGAADNQVAMSDKGGPSHPPKEKTTTYKGDAFIVSKGDAQYALSVDGHVGEIWLTTPGDDYKAYDGKKRSFLTLWVSEEMGGDSLREHELQYKLGKFSEESVVDLRKIWYRACLILVWVEAVVGENDYMPMHVVEVYRLECSGAGPAAAKRLMIDPKQNCLVRDSEVRMRQVYAENSVGAVPDKERGKVVYM
ncbi:hypothetical protein VTK26DRAFT_2324 [Humicola hyalothermophila]